MSTQSSSRLLDDDDAASRAPRAGEVIAGKYRVEGVVGSGGMGVVVSAQHLQLGQKVAIKVLSVSALDGDRRTEATARFLREGQSAARLTSDHVVRIYDVGTSDSGEPFMVMELLRGEDLATLIDRVGPAPLDVAVDYIVQACDAVGEAHAHGIVHRDLKPSNLFVAKRNDGRVIVKVLDFGISKAVNPGHEHFEGNLTSTRSVVGSPYYMSPEQVRDAKRVDTRTDLWSLGMILYELLIGEPAFHADTLPGICAAIAADPPPSLRARRPDLPPEMERIVLRCLEKDQSKRFQTVAELVQALTPFLPRLGSTNSVDYAARASQAALPEGSRRTSPNQATLDPADVGGTLMSPRFTDSGSRPAGSAPVVVLPPGRSTPLSGKRSDLENSDTLLSGRLPKKPAHRRAFLLAGLLGFWLIAGAVAFVMWRQPPAAPEANESVAGPARFSLAIESVPPGADVLEGDRVLGTTPTSITIENAAVTSAPRRFTVRASGYEPYPIAQGPSESSVRVRATLTPVAQAAPAAEAAPVPTAAAASASPPVPAPQKARPVVQRPAVRPTTRPSTTTNSDIRLER